MRNLNMLIIIAIVVALGFAFGGCSSKQSIVSEMSGTWKSDKTNEPIKINLSGDQKAIGIGGNTVPVTVKNIDEGTLMVKMEAKPANGSAAVWSLRQVWNDNGSSFIIKFDHDGEQETLSRG